MHTKACLWSLSSLHQTSPCIASTLLDGCRTPRVSSELYVCAFYTTSHDITLLQDDGSLWPRIPCAAIPFDDSIGFGIPPLSSISLVKCPFKVGLRLPDVLCLHRDSLASSSVANPKSQPRHNKQREGAALLSRLRWSTSPYPLLYRVCSTFRPYNPGVTPGGCVDCKVPPARYYFAHCHWRLGGIDYDTAWQASETNDAFFVHILQDPSRDRHPSL
ncbi:hypothetical protein BDW69DRAFT_11103 [Aspergillus filifer]